MQNFIKELSNYLENGLTNNSAISFNSNSEYHNLILDDLTLYNKKIITRFKDEMLTSRSNILQNHAESTKEKGQLFYIYDISSNQKNSYNICSYNPEKNNEIITKPISELPENINLGTVLRKQGDNFILDIDATKIISEKINIMVNEKIEEQNQYLDSMRVNGHTYEVGEKYSGRIWLYDLNNVVGGGIEGIEEIDFPKELYETAKQGDLFIYENGEYHKK